MQKLYSLLALFFIGLTSHSQIVIIPDANFKAKLLAAGPTANIAYNASFVKIKIDTNNDGEIQQSEANLVYSLNVSNSSIVDLTGINFFTNLQSLYCDGNQIITLELNTLTHLQTLWCQNNQLTTLFIKNGINQNVNATGNPNGLYICADEGEVVDCYCTVNSYCNFVLGGTFYKLQGNARYDNNNDGCDAGDNGIANLKYAVSNGSFFEINSNLAGNYAIPVQAGTVTITPILEMPAYFSVSPVSSTVAFPATASPFIQNFCVTPNGTHNDLEITLLPNIPARPGNNAVYKIIYKNKGTHSQSGMVDLAFDNAVLHFAYANPSVTSEATNSLSWSFSNLLPFETREILVILGVNAPTDTPAVNSDDILYFTATVTGATDETPVDNSSVLNQTVVNSFDPNDKTCTEGSTVSSSMIGKYVHYVIRFENTGTANAKNIVIQDYINASKFDIASLVPLSSSASFVTKISNSNSVEFIFENINLPFDDANNDGYIAFKIKTKSSLVVGNTFSNNAYIYFDYNEPITTNTYTTTIQALGTADFDFSSVFSLSPVPTKNTLTITAKETVNLSSVSIYNAFGQLIQVNTHPGETVDVSNLKTGSYFIKIISDKGSATGKFIKE
ncbi:T9SS type A sorting domain-containing protein [Flavobacterium silvisoli]|uniref:T9SS type A sorting domain-containing protein n=1 Tax=Flavobacterium silvisoli TaxID=2529433 RepID=A0A4Q9Z3N8_9FLAO|nr:T9SS type A sorting domain-containing protein [Flavobacterium silvisoli]TBX71013.1 T9SS type A sorting domain-containing protein [Flavobacterium silvisoli]